MYIPEKGYSEATARIIDEEVRRLSDEAYQDAIRMLDENWAAVENVAQALLRYETLDAADVLKVMRGETIGKPTVSELLAAEARKTREAAAAAAGANPTGTGSTDVPPGTMPTPA
jgi:cell division protease FtsH